MSPHFFERRNGECSPTGIETHLFLLLNVLLFVVEMGNAARLGLKLRPAACSRYTRSSRNGECSPTGIETIALQMLAIPVSLVEMGNAARLGLKLQFRTFSQNYTAVEMGNAARLGLKRKQTTPLQGGRGKSKWGMQPDWD